jgi:hypothetical protein
VRGLFAAIRPDEFGTCFLGWVESMGAHLTAEFKEGSEVMRVGVTGLPPREAAAVVNAVAAAYVQELAVMNRAASLQQRKRIEDARADVQQKLERRRVAVADLARAVGLPPAEADRRAAVAALYEERAGLRVAAAESEEAVNGRRIAAALADVDGRIRRAEVEGPRLNAAAAELAPLEAADAALGSELVRLELEASAPPRVTVLQPATAEPGKE